MRRTKAKQLWVGWEHGILTMQIRHSAKEVHTWRLQQVPRSYFLDMIHRPDPERRMNELLTMYSGREA
jgi:hypothetical protein